MENIKSHIISVLMATGLLGSIASWVIAWIVGHTDAATHWVIQRALENPKGRDILTTYREDIEKVFDIVDQRAKTDLDAAAKQTPK